MSTSDTRTMSQEGGLAAGVPQVEGDGLLVAVDAQEAGADLLAVGALDKGAVDAGALADSRGVQP